MSTTVHIKNSVKEELEELKEEEGFTSFSDTILFLIRERKAEKLHFEKDGVEYIKTSLPAGRFEVIQHKDGSVSLAHEVWTENEGWIRLAPPESAEELAEEVHPIFEKLVRESGNRGEEK